MVPIHKKIFPVKFQLDRTTGIHAESLLNSFILYHNVNFKVFSTKIGLENFFFLICVIVFCNRLRSYTSHLTIKTVILTDSQSFSSIIYHAVLDLAQFHFVTFLKYIILRHHTKLDIQIWFLFSMNEMDLVRMF